MKHLKDILKEEGVFATPANTMGMGNPMPPTDGCCGSEPLAPIKKKTKKKPVKEAFFDIDSEDERSQINTMMRIWVDSVHDGNDEYELDVVGDEINITATGHWFVLVVDMKKNPIPKGYKMGKVTLRRSSTDGAYKIELRNCIQSNIDDYIPSMVINATGSFEKVIVKIYGKPSEIVINKAFECSEFYIETSARINDRPDVWLPKDCVFFEMNCRGIRSVRNLPQSCSHFRAQPEVLWNMLRDQLMVPQGCKWTEPI